MAANILPTYLLPTPLDLGCGVKGQNSTYREHGYVAYEIKKNHESSNMQIFWLQIPSPRPSDPVVKSQLVQNMVVLHIKLKVITNAATHILSLHSHSNVGWIIT